MKTEKMKTERNIWAVILVLFMMQTTTVVYSQTVSDFESLNLTPESYWNGSDTPMGTTFSDGNAIFPNFYDTLWGGFWSSGWAYSNKTDTVTEGFTNMYSAYTGSGVNNSQNYAVGMHGSVIRLKENAKGKVVHGFYVTNGTFAALSMLNGDMVGKVFGGDDGNDPDWFKLTVYGYYNGALTNDSVEFYLSDYRFSDNSLNYIVNTWEWVDLTGLGNVDSLLFTMSSSDVGDFGMNTPSFFCLDNFTTADSYAHIHNYENNIKFEVFPNPVKDFFIVELPVASEALYLLELFNVTGELVYQQILQGSPQTINVQDLPSGVYIVSLSNTYKRVNQLIIKQ